ncbi:MAG: DUF6049 family protein, partial [Pseudonocardia sp.]|nr:DUF6049 family protein [Pseudonocardia sp.]
ADADLVALTRGGLVDTAVGAVTAGRGLVADLLGTPVLANTTWPVDGVVDEPTLDTLEAAGVRSLVLSADGLNLPGRADPVGTVPVAAAAPGTTAVITDPLVTLAADGPSATAPGVTDRAVTDRGGAATVTPATGPLAGQDVLGTVAFRAIETLPTGGPLVIAPPHRWDADGAAGRTLLEGLDTLVAEGVLTPRGFDTAVGPPTDTTERTLDYPIGAGAREVAPSAVAALGPVLEDIDDLASSVVDDELGVDPDDMFNPLLLGAARPASASWRGTPELAPAAAAAYAARIADVRAAVSVIEPPSPFSLGTSSSPLLLTVANGLPVTMSVRVEVASTSGLRVAPIPVVEVPPLGRRQIQVSAEVLRSGVFTVAATVRTLDGGLLGAPSRLQVRSTAYGTITLWLTGTAGVLLVVLAARRILRRIRNEPGRPADRPGRPGSPETLPHTARTPTVRHPHPGRETDLISPEGPTLPVPAPAAAPRPANGPTPAGPRTGRNPRVPSGLTEPSGPAGPGAPGRPAPVPPGP